MILFQNCTTPFHTILHFAMLMTLYLYVCNALSLFICKKPSIELRQAIHRNDIAYKNHPKTKLRNIKKKDKSQHWNQPQTYTSTIDSYTPPLCDFVETQNIGMEEEICLLFLSGILIFFFFGQKSILVMHGRYCPH